MYTRWRQGGIFVAGLAAGVLIAAVATLSTHRDGQDAADARPSGAPAVVAGTAPTPTPTPTSTPAPQRTAACTFPPVVAGGGKGDGQVSLAEPDARIAIVRGKEAMAAGRDRDAEIAFITACRAAAKAAPAGSVEIADAEYQLARHYAGLAQERAPNRAELMRRARPLYEDSLRIYLAQLGDHHEKTRFAAEGLASLKQESAQAATRPTRAPPPEAMAPRPREPLTSQAMGAAAAPDVVAQPQPSFDCDKARSAPEKLICGDAELAQLDRELGSIYARAKSMASDREAFQRVSDREWRRRETECGDRDCLLRWYAQRKHQLQEQIETSEAELTQR